MTRPVLGERAVELLLEANDDRQGEDADELPLRDGVAEEDERDPLRARRVEVGEVDPAARAGASPLDRREELPLLGVLGFVRRAGAREERLDARLAPLRG